MSTSQVLQRLYSLDTASPDLFRYLHSLFRNDDEEQYLSTLQGSELTRLVDFLDEILDVTPNTDDVFRRCLHKLRTICGHHGVLPPSYTILGDLSRVGDDPVGGGGFSDVWKGSLNGRKVCIKDPRSHAQNREAVEKSFCKEAITWKRLEHPNVVAFIGVTRNPLQIVSDWMPNGTLREYVNENPGANRVGLLLDVAEGLNYLHANHTTHGDLKGPNILIDCTGHACLADFGLASVVRGLSSVLVTEVQGYTERWTAPEVLWSGDRITREADVFAFGMVVVEVFTGKSPFSEFNARVTTSKIMDGERPDRPQEPALIDPVWEVTLACWQQDPACRPATAEVVGILRECYRPYTADLQVSSISQPQPVRRLVRAKNDVDCVTTPLGFPSDYRRINELSRELANRKQGSKRELCIELSQLCTLWHTVPTSYELGGVVKLKLRARHPSKITGIWKGMYDGEVVALKVLRLHKGKGGGNGKARLPTGDSDITAAKQRFCAAAVLMKQIEHVNIVPFYGVSTTTSEFSLVFPWYKNGNIEQYLEENPDVDRYDLLLGAVKGLRFLHSNGVVHGAFRPDHILIDDDDNVRLEIVIPDTPTLDGSTILRTHLRLLVNDFCYGEPKTESMESDVYELAIVIYEILTGIHVYREGRDLNGEVKLPVMPVRPPGAFDDLFWELLVKCWTPRWYQDCPQTDEVYRTVKRRPKVNRASLGRFEAQSSLYKYELHIRGIKFPNGSPPSQELYVKFKCGDKVYTTSPTNCMNDWGEYTWDSPQNLVLESDHGRYGIVQVSLVLVVRSGLRKSEKVYARVDYPFQANRVSEHIVVDLADLNTGFKVEAKVLVLVIAK